MVATGTTFPFEAYAVAKTLVRLPVDIVMLGGAICTSTTACADSVPAPPATRQATPIAALREMHDMAVNPGWERA